MKKIRHLLPLLLVLLLLVGMTPLGAFAQDENSGEPTEAAPSPVEPEGSDSPDEAPPLAEDTTPTPTSEPTSAPTEAPAEPPAPTNVPDVDPPNEDGPTFGEPYGDGIVMGPDNPPEDAPQIFSDSSGTAAISVHNAYMSNGTQIKYVGSFNWNGHSVGGNGSPRYQITANGKPAYCIEPGGYLPGGSQVNTSAASVWRGFSTAKKDAIRMALLCGEPGNSSNLSGNFGSQYTATQMIVWEIIVGARSTSAPYNCSDSKVINSVCGGGANSEVKTVYNQISSAMQTYNTLPSFVSPPEAPPSSHAMPYDGSKYSVTLTDTNNVLSNFTFSSSDGNLSFNVSGNNLTITSSSKISSATVNVTRKSAVSASSTITAYAASGRQETVVGVEAVSGTPGYFGVYTTGEPELPPPPVTTPTPTPVVTPTPAPVVTPTPTPKGNMKIVKTSDDGKVSGITFTVSGPSGTQYVTTNYDGTITVYDLSPGTYTVTETVPAGYTADRASQTVTVRNGETATVNFHNSRKTGGLKIVKTSDDGKVSGITFTVQGGSVNQTVTTGADGTITVPGLTPGQYTVTETVPEGYVCDNPSQTVTVEYDQIATVNFSNKLKMWRVAVTKVDAEAGTRRSSDVTLEGAQYGVYKDGTLQDTYATDGFGHFTTKYYPCGSGWTLQEIVAPTGYNVDPNSYPIGAEPGTVELAANDTEITVKEQIIKGKLVIVKQDALTQTPLPGATFTVYDETGEVVTEGPTGEDGTFTVEELPYGKYTAKETTAPEGYQLDETVFEFAIETEDQIVTLTRENVYCVGSITVHKVDGQGAALAGTMYLLEYSEDGSTWNPVTYREDTTPTIGGCTSLGLENGQLTTGEDGTVVFDGLVANGKVYYRLTETKTQPGLSLLKDPVFQGTLPLDGETEKEYDISYTITNNRITALPQTGGSGLLLPVTIGTILLGLAGCTGIFVAHNKKSKSGKEI